MNETLNFKQKYDKNHGTTFASRCDEFVIKMTFYKASMIS